MGRDEKSRRRYPALATQLVNEPYRFNFFQAVRILERLRAGKPVGHDGPPGDECVRFRSHLSLDFPASAIQLLNVPADHRLPPAMTVTFMGLTGPSGALPRFYTEFLLERRRHKDPVLREFLDLFNHRLISLFYRAWERNRFYLGFERAERMHAELRDEPRRQRAFVIRGREQVDRFSQVLLDLGGFGFAATRWRATGDVTAGAPDYHRRFIAALLCRPVCSTATDRGRG